MKSKPKAVLADGTVVETWNYDADAVNVSPGPWGPLRYIPAMEVYTLNGESISKERFEEVIAALRARDEAAR